MMDGMTGASVDVVVVGGGHNGLVCAAYLARAGLDVVVVEQNEVPGGALMWSEWQGHLLEHGAVEHTAVLTSGVIDELGLDGSRPVVPHSGRRRDPPVR